MGQFFYQKFFGRKSYENYFDIDFLLAENFWI